MNRVVLQYWEQTIKNKGVFNDGCSIHTDIDERNKYISKIYENRNDDIPDEYDRIIGNGVEAFIDDDIYELVEMYKTVKLSDVEFRNLIGFDKITVK